jgi:hypothetical protein
VAIVTGTQAFQFDVNAIIQMILWGLVLVAVASAFVNLGSGKKTDTSGRPSGQTYVVERLLTEDRVREIVREEIAEVLRPIQAALSSTRSKSTTGT